MKLSHKIGKIFSREARLRGLRRLERRLHPLPVRRLLAQVDPARLHEIQSRYATSTDDRGNRQYRKYLSAFDWRLEEYIPRAQVMPLHPSPPPEILDI